MPYPESLVAPMRAEMTSRVVRFSYAAHGASFFVMFRSSAWYALYRASPISAFAARAASAQDSLETAKRSELEAIRRQAAEKRAAASRLKGVRTVMVSNGYIDEEPLNDLCGVLGAVKVDLKSFTQKFYVEQCKGEVKPVLETLRRLRKKGMWTEIVVLIIPTLNDGEQEIRDLASFVKNELGPEVPVHFTRFHPSYRLMNLPSTPVPILERAHRIATEAGLQFVYLGNVAGHPAENTYCPACKKMVIHRIGMAVVENRMKAGRCPDCGYALPGIWS